MSPRAKPNPFSAVLHGAKGAFVDLQRQLRLKVRESKTEGMLARGPGNFQTETHSGSPCCGEGTNDGPFGSLNSTCAVPIDYWLGRGGRHRPKG